jgi:GntR family transcriptional regulator
MSTFDQSIDKRSKTPYYVQLANILRQVIVSGEYERGDVLPPERELENAFNVSRNTVRQAITILENEGYVHRNHGRGTFVTPLKPKNKVRIDAFIEHKGLLTILGYTPSFSQLSTDIMIPEEKIRKKLELAENEKVHRRRGITYADGRPAIYTEEYIGIDRTNEEEIPWDPNNVAFFDFLEVVTGDRVMFVSVEIVPVVADEDLTQIFELPDCSPLLLLEATKHGSVDPKPLGFGLNYYNPEIVTFSVLRT